MITERLDKMAAEVALCEGADAEEATRLFLKALCEAYPALREQIATADEILGHVKAWLPDDLKATSAGDGVRALRARHDRLREALEGVVRVADRKTVEFDAARAALSATANPALGETA